MSLPKRRNRWLASLQDLTSQMLKRAIAVRARARVTLRTKTSPPHWHARAKIGATLKNFVDGGRVLSYRAYRLGLGASIVKVRRAAR